MSISRFIAIFAITMKMFLFIISFILSCYFNSGSTSAQEHNEIFSTAIVETTDQDSSGTERGLYTNTLLPARAARLYGGNGGYTPTLRSNNSIRRIQVSQKHPFRIIKAGKIIDRQHFFAFQTTFYLFPSGIRIMSRYIHTICQLLI